jgi:hypothetical protein
MKAFETSQPKFTQLEGICGVFNSINSNFRVRFFSTYANSRELNYKELLSELKPMRERLDISNIENINQVLQRDLDDYRIAKGLIPYLLNMVNGRTPDENHLAFFPGILGVLIPKNYLLNNNEINNTIDIHYPLMVENEDKSELLYFNSSKENVSWKIKHLKSESGKVSPLSLLEFDRNKAEIIVLDGQHRANAFRVASNEFFSNPENDIYEPYYKGVNVYPTTIETDLPVTLICFERINPLAEILPDFISRKLFIAVNNNSKSISPSRLVLLNDKDPSSIIANVFYSAIAEQYSFKTDTENLSLIHLGFDISSALRENKESSVLNISNPELLNFVFDWYFFASRNYNRLNFYFVSQNRELKWSPDILGGLMPRSTPLFDIVKNEEGEKIKILLDSENRNIVEEEFRHLHFKAFYKIFNELNFLKCHYKATSEMEIISRSGAWTTSKFDTWRFVFKGGEGLYDSFKKLIDNNEDPNRADLNNINTAIKEIETDFYNIRANFSGLSVLNSNSMFNSFYSLAFQVALFMAFYDHLENEERQLDNSDDILEGASSFLEKLNCIEIPIWSNVFNEVRKHLWKDDTNAKKWPAYHKLILRLIQGDNEYFAISNNYNISPEAKIFEIKFENAFSGFLKSEFSENERSTLTADYFKNSYSIQIDSWIQESMNQVELIFRDYLNLTVLPYNSFQLSNTIIDKNLS